MISYKTTTDLSQSAELTYRNMRSYYEHYSVDWEPTKILEQITNLKNRDILVDGNVVGVIRLSFNDDGCFLRDFQVSEKFQNKGVGSEALVEIRRLAVEAGAKKVQLKVFKISPAHRLYEKHGFKVTSEDDRFFYMERYIA